MRIVLLGYMGSGKTTIGIALAENMGLDFLDLDAHIEALEGKSIAAIFDEKGEVYFRKKEQEYLQQIMSGQDNFVLSTGGGTPCYGQNMNTILKGTENAFYLKVSIEELVDRLSKQKEHRPLIQNIADSDLPEFIGKHLFERSFFYAGANHTIICDKKTPEAIGHEIKAKLV